MNKVWITSLLLLLPVSVSAELYITIIQGLGGTSEYEQQFSEQTDTIRAAAGTVTDAGRIGLLSGADATRDTVLAYFSELRGMLTTEDRLAVYMIGHGSYDGYDYKFMIPGPDLTDTELLEILDSLPTSNQLLINTGSAGGALQERLKAEGRTLITGTRSGNERLATRFGTYFVEALTNPGADINKNNAISVQEAFDYAERQVKDYFEYEGQLATEHPVLGGDMNSLVLARIRPQQPLRADPRLMGLLNKRDEIDARVEELQLRRNDMATDSYLQQLQNLMIELSITQGQIDEFNQGNGNEQP